MSGKRSLTLFLVLILVAMAAAGGWYAATFVQSPADVAARTAAPAPSPILVPVDERVLSSSIVIRGTARFGRPQPVSIAPSVLKPNPGLITATPRRNRQIEQGEVILTASGRPVFALEGEIPAYRDLIPGIVGDDVLQLERALERLGFDPGERDGRYDERTSAAVSRWYESSGWEPFGPTPQQMAEIRRLERDYGEARKNRLAAENAAAAASLAVESARASAENDNRIAETNLAAKLAHQRRLLATNADNTPLVVESERAKAEFAATAAQAELEATIADRARIVLDPRQPDTARAAAEAKLELAKANAQKSRLEGELAVRVAERDAELAAAEIEAARVTVESARLAGELKVQAAIDAAEVAKLSARLAAEQARRLAADLEVARSKLGIQVPVDEIVFFPDLPVRVETLQAKVGDQARGPVMAVTDNQLVIDSALPIESAPLVSPGMRVTIDEQALGIDVGGVVEQVASTPGTHGVDGYHFYLEVRVDDTPTRLEGMSLRLTIPIESTDGAVTVVPVSALSLSPDGTTRIQIENDGALEYVDVEPGLSADGFVQVTASDGALAPGQMVVIGYERP